MTRAGRFGIFLCVGLLVFVGLSLSGSGRGQDDAILSLPAFVSPAWAVVGRPLTPVSVAGVARRTVRRCAVGVYSC